MTDPWPGLPEQNPPEMEDQPPIVVRCVAASLPTISTQRGGVCWLPTPEGGWPAPALPTRRARLMRLLHAQRVDMARRLHALARWVGDEPEPGFYEW